MTEYAEYICIVGAGTISNHLAVELLNRGHKVLVVEAGGLDLETCLLSRSDYKFNSPSMLPENVHRVGGGGNYWIGRIGEFLARDFESLPGLRNESWPFEKSELERYYRSVYSRLIGTELLDDEFIDEYFAKYTQIPEGFSIRPIRYTEPQLLKELFLDKLNNSNLIFLTEKLVVSIGKDADNVTPLIRIKDTDGRLSEHLVKKVIVAGGALQSVKLFLNSNEIHNDRNISTAGKFLMEHLDGYIGEISVSRKNKDFIKLISLNSARILKSMPSLNSGISLILESRKNSEVTVGFEIVNKIVKYRFAPGPNGLDTPSRNILRNSAFFLERVLRKIVDISIHFFREKFLGLYTYSIWLKAEELPFHSSAVDIDPKSGILNYSHKISAETSISVRKALSNFESLVTERNLGKVRFYDGVMDPSKVIQLRPNWHPMGTLRMGVPGESVVDKTLKLHGEEHIYFLSSAVFPTGSNQNPVFTTLALGTRLAEHLSQDV